MRLVGATPSRKGVLTNSSQLANRYNPVRPTVTEDGMNGIDEMPDRSECTTSVSLFAHVQANDAEAWAPGATLRTDRISLGANAGLQPSDAADVSQEVFSSLTTHMVCTLVAVTKSLIPDLASRMKSTHSFRIWYSGFAPPTLMV